MKEINFRTWHEEDASFHVEFTPYFAQCTPGSKVITWSEVLRITTDNAGEDFSRRDMPWDFLQEKGLVMIVSRISYHVHKMPAFGQKVTLNTWESAPMGPLCTRNFEFADSETKEVLLTGQTLWTCLDFKNKKIIPGKAYPYRPTPTIVTDFEGIKPGKISIPEGMETIGTHKVLYSELDANGHTNNSKYINFAIDNLPAEFQNKQIKDLRLNYSKEAMLGETMEIKAKYDADLNKYTVQGVVEGVSSFECELYY